jgi:hypothetical protein
MRIKIILALALSWFCLNQKVLAQAQWYADVDFSEDVYFDTLHIVLPGNDKVLILGKEFKELKIFADKAEALKITFIADLKAAYASGKLSADAQEVYYFYKNASQRRVKAEAAEYTEKRVDVAQEMLRMDLLLPKHKFVILDMENKMEWQLYVNNPDSLAFKLENTNIKQAIEVGTANKKYRRQSTQLWVDTDSSAYSLSHFQHKRQLSFSVGPSVGVSLIGNTISPNFGIMALFNEQNKYGASRYRLGVGFTEYVFVTFENRQIKDHQLFYSIDALAAFNIAQASKRAKWFGIQAGVFQTYDSNDALHNAIKLNLLTSGFSDLTYSFDFIFTKNDFVIYGITAKLPF